MKHFVNNRAVQSGIWMALLLFWTCSIHDEQPAGEVLVSVGDRIITSQDFIRRAEYTIRPDFCAGDNYIHRKIILNSLIAEKILALEEEPNSSLNADTVFQDYIRGRQEQAMRQWFYKLKALDQVEIDTSELASAYKMAGRTVKIGFYQLRGKQDIPAFTKAYGEGLSFEEIFVGLTGKDTIPSRSINWLDREDNAIRDLIFTEDLTKHSVLGPLELEDGSVIVMKVLGWKTQPAITESQISLRVNDVKERLTELKAKSMFKDVVSNIMSGKKLELNQAVFLPYARAAADQYLRTADEKKAQLNQAIWDTEEHLETGPIETFPAAQKGEMLFSVDGTPWTVSDFEAALRRHPLVFRKRTMGHSEFAKQMKLAIADMIRDEYVTQEAYKMKLDQVPSVRQNVNQFKDHYLSRQLRSNYLNSVIPDSIRGNLDEMDLLDDYLAPYIDSLQAQYSDQIEIDMSRFSEIELTRVPMMVSQRNAPYPLIVPAFPRLTTDTKLDYGLTKAGGE